MQKSAIAVVSLVLGVCASASAQDGAGFFSKFQVHGNLAQGLMFSTSNNYMTANTSDGTVRWGDAVLSVSRPITDTFRIGAQARSYAMGRMGSYNVRLDWAYADYKPSRYFGIRLGKVKTPTGLYNDVQDIDAAHQWALLPSVIYSVDYRAFSLSHVGGAVYGEVAPAPKMGTIEYQFFGGARSQAADEGLSLTLTGLGIATGSSTGPTWGADIRWHLPVEGAMLGASYSRTDLSSDGRMGPIPLAIAVGYRREQFYAQYEKDKLTLSAEFMINPAISRYGPAPELYPIRSWYGMASYHLTPKLTAGTYYGIAWAFMMGNRDRTDPNNYLKDAALNTRFDFNRYFYMKLEAHYFSGNAVGFYRADNPAGYDNVTRLLAARVGFTI